MNCKANIYLIFSLIQLTWGQLAKSSLTFVIDDTGSMGDDIDQVKYGAELVFDTVLNTNSSQIENFILVTFNDPAPPILRTVTRDRDLFKNELNSIRVDGGDDCPELSLSGIKLALEQSLPRSYLYVFTDATAKDLHLQESVQSLAIKKNTQIVFLLTGECTYDRNDPHFQSYYKLAKATSGQVFHIHKQDVEEILNYVAETVSHPKTIISVTNLPPGDGHNFTVPVDAGMKDMVVSGSGSDVKITGVSGPDGSKRDYKEVVSLPGAVVAKIADTEPGNYTITGGAKTTSTFVTSAATEIEFKYGFLPVEPTSIGICASQPKAAEKTHLAIELVTDKSEATLNTVEILDVDGNVIEEKPLKLIDGKQKLYATEKITPPTSLFKIAIKGYVKDAKTGKADFRRTSPTAIEAQKPTLEPPENRSPTVSITEKLLNVKFGQRLKIPCKINGYPKPDTIWIDKNGTVLPSYEIVVESPYDYLNILEIDKIKDSSVYTCKAANSFGDASEIVTVEVGKEAPKINKTTRVVRVKSGDDAEMTCRVYKGEPAPKIFWYFLPLDGQDYVMVNGSEVLSLKNVDASQAGTYKCVAINEFGHDNQVTDLIVEYPPSIRSGVNYVKSLDGRPTSLRCYVTGIPKPHVDWFLDGVQIVSDRKHHIYRDNSLRFTGSIENRGRFTCVATNTHGSANRTILVDYVGPVTIKPPEQSTFDLKVGDSLKLPCEADGYPQPTIKWLFYSEDSSETVENLRPSDASGSLNLRTVQLDRNGYYVCVASNRDTSANMTYQVKVLAPPDIQKTGKKVFNAVLGDLVLKLPCKTTGNPKPAVTWTKDGLNLASGTEWYDIEDDGTLFIKNVDNLSGGTYVCHAENVLGDDQEMFAVIVKQYPDEKDTTKVITLEEGSTSNIECDVPHTIVDSIRWFKDRRLLYVGELTLRKVLPSNSGTYTCHVSTDHGSQSKSVKVVVGSKPTFVSEVNTLVSFEEGSAAFLDCTAFGDPHPEVQWYYEDKPIRFTEEVYDVMMTFDTRGRYTCVVSNTFGSINRTYEISSRDCLLNIEKDFTSDQPLMVDPTREWPSFDNREGFLRIPFGESVVLFCPGGFKYFPEMQVTATCEREKTFRIGRNVYKFNQLDCREEVGITVRKTGRKCLTEDSEEVKVGYMAGGKFMEVFEVCVDKEKNAPAYAKHRMRRSLADIEPKISVWHNDEDSIPLNAEEVYECEAQKNHISMVLRKWFHVDDKCCFRKRQLINSRDLLAGLSQKAAFTYLNVAPQWSSCNSKNWDLLEKKVRELAQSSYEDYTVWTGTAGVLQLRNSVGNLVDVRLEDKRYLEQAVPRYFWKLVQSPKTNSSLAIVQLNIPDLNEAEAYSNIVCDDICRDIPWLKGYFWRNPTDGYTFCCSLQQFEEAFGYSGHFGRENRNILDGTSALSAEYFL